MTLRHILVVPKSIFPNCDAECWLVKAWARTDAMIHQLKKSLQVAICPLAERDSALLLLMTAIMHYFSYR